MGYQEITTFDDLKKLISGDKLVVVELFDSEMGPQSPFTSIVKEFSETHTKADFAKVDMNKVPEATEYSSTAGIPAVLFFKKGEVVDEAGDRSGDFVTKLYDFLD